MRNSQSQQEFTAFVARHEPALRRALAGHLPIGEVSDAVAEALGYAWQHWDRVRYMENPAGYLFRVGQSRSRRRKSALLPSTPAADAPRVEPALVAALRDLPTMQRSCVWLVHACGWSYSEAATALGVSASAVGTHVSRALPRLRASLGVSS
jgi:RNA polymerase sigma-70 factor (ECF subfamily)